MKQNLYSEIWRKVGLDLLDLIVYTNNQASIQLSNESFEAVGNRKDYSFTFELVEGRIFNNFEGSAVARDLAEIILNSSGWMKFPSNKHLKITLDKNFTLHISVSIV